MRDLVVCPEGPLRPGTDQRASITTRPGGGGANLAAWLAATGVTVRLLACVGHDDLDAESFRLRAVGVEPALVGSRERPTGQLIALVGPDRDRSFLTDRGANDVLDHWPAGLMDGVGWLHVSGYSLVGDRTRATVLGVLAKSRAASLPVSFDPGSAGFLAELGAEAVLGWLGDAALCCLSADEAATLTGCDAIEAQLDALATRFPLVIVKDGPRGVRAGSAEGRRWSVPAPSVVVRDTIGAGDAFMAGVLAARLAGDTVDAALVRGTVLAARAVAQVGGAPPVAPAAACVT